MGGNNRKTIYGYDFLNRKTSESWIGVGRVSVRAIGYTHNAVGNVITATDPDAKYTYGYDVLNRLTSLDNTGTTGVPVVVFNYLYDAVGRLVTVGDRISGTNAGQTDYTFDQLNRVTKITQAGVGVQNKRVDMTYNQVNQMTGLTRFSDLGGVNLVAETSYTYDQNQRLIQLAHKKGTNNLASYNYTFDAANKLTKVVSSADGTVDYAYDATNQLTGADHSNQTDEAYQYDANGNRTNAGYQTGTNNQLLADGQFTYQYDQEGNRTKRTETATGKVTEYVWDYHNRLAQVLFKDGSGAVTKSIEYIYDVNNQRIGKKIDGVVTESYVIDRNQIALVFDGSGVQKSRYLYGTQVDQVLAEESGTQVNWFLIDHQGTVKDVIDNAGTVIDHITYDSFGRIVGQTSSIELKFAYTGREWDGETGQYYYRARYYDAAVGRFISEDPIGFNAGDANLLRYVDNNTINYNDPSGFGKFSAVDTEMSRTGGGGFGSGGYNNVVPFNRGGNISPGGTSTSGAITPAYRPSVTTTPNQPFRPLPYGPIPNNQPDDLPIRRSPVPTAPEPYGPPEPFGPPAPYRPPSEREVQRMLDKRFQDIQRQNPKHQDPKRVVITKTIVVTEEQLEAERTESPDPNCDEEKKKRCKSGIFKDFAHGAPIVDINNIVANGINLSEANQRKRGGLVNKQGFYTIELTEINGVPTGFKLDLAMQFGTNRGRPAGILIFKLCKEVYNDLVKAGQVEKRDIAGVPGNTETIFLPTSFNTLNREKIISQIIDERQL